MGILVVYRVFRSWYRHDSNPNDAPWQATASHGRAHELAHRRTGELHVRARSLYTIIVLLALLTAGFGPPVISDGGYPPLRLYPEQIVAIQATRQPPAITAKSMLLVDLDSGQTLAAVRPDLPLPPASTAKLMTALIVLRRARLDDVVTVSATAAGTEGSRMGLSAGETLTVQDLLYGLLLPSGNDAAVALAEHVSGSEAGFVDLMNQTAASMGLGQSHFVNSHGLDAEGQTASATDLLKLARAALAYPLFVKIVGTSEAQVAGHALVSTNELLKTYRGADGIKTGTTDLAGECLVASVSRDGHRLALVLLGSKDRYGDAAALFKWAEANWQWRPIALPDDALAWQAGSDGQSYRLRADPGTDLFLPTWEWSMVQPVRVITPTVPLTSTLPVGTLRMTLGSQVLASVPLHVWRDK